MGPVPADDRLRPDQDRALVPVAPDAPRQHPEQPVALAEPGPPARGAVAEQPGPAARPEYAGGARTGGRARPARPALRPDPRLSTGGGRSPPVLVRSQHPRGSAAHWPGAWRGFRPWPWWAPGRRSGRPALRSGDG